MKTKWIPCPLCDGSSIIEVMPCFEEKQELKKELEEKQGDDANGQINKTFG